MTWVANQSTGLYIQTKMEELTGGRIKSGIINEYWLLSEKYVL